MDLRINNIKFTGIQPVQNKPSKATTAPIHTNTTVLPGYQAYMALSFGKKTPEFDSEDFLLPSEAKPDKYQTDAAMSLLKGNNTIVTAPTGTGKTAIAYFVIKKNFEEGKKTFYTTPLKALSNQKYNDLKELFGKENVGILTGDRKENAQAPIVIMTTEIYRNMVTSHYFNAKNDSLENLKTVIFDEFHYMGDPDRGGIWEESIMFTPQNTQILALSATVGNNKKISNWINAIKKKQTQLIDVPASNRHVPLQFIMHNSESKTIATPKHQANLNLKAVSKKYFDGKFNSSENETLKQLAAKMGFKNSSKGKSQVIYALRNEYKNKTVPISEIQEFLRSVYDVNPDDSLPLLLKLTDKKAIPLSAEKGKIVASQRHSRQNPFSVINAINWLNKENKLPAIAFVFSKKFSEQLLKIAASSGKDLTNAKEKNEIQQILDKYQKEFGLYSTNLNEEALLKGYAIHSAAILPLQKQLIEELFNKKLLKAVFATETLAAGINMPARTVIMTDYQKPSATVIKSSNSKTSFLRPLSANEFHQMSGRAGRRGIDKIGYVILLADSPEKQAQFEKLIHSDPEPISSTLKLDASNVTGFFENLDNPQDMKRILEISFSLYNTANTDRTLRLNNHMAIFSEYMRLLEQYGFLKKIQTGYTTTDAGDLISSIKGRPQIPIVKAILDKKLQGISAPDLAGVIAAIASNQDSAARLDKVLNTDYSGMSDKLMSINLEISEKLAIDFGFTLSELNSNNSNDEILKAIEQKYGDILKKDINEINKQRESLRKLIDKESNESKKISSYFYINNDTALQKLKNHAKRLKHEQSIIKRTHYLRDLLDKRLGIILQEKYANAPQGKYDIYNSLVDDFSKYNTAVSGSVKGIDKISMNPTSLILVGKWAEANAASPDYKSNWQYLCSMLNEAGSIKYEGDLFNAVAQTIDFIHQIEGVLIKASKMESASIEDREYYNDLIAKCKEAVSLIKCPPLYNTEEI